MAVMNAADIAEYRRQHVPLYDANKMKLGVFGTNVSYGTLDGRANFFPVQVSGISQYTNTPVLRYLRSKPL